MKRIIIVLILVLGIALISYAKNDSIFYYYRGSRVPLQICNNKLSVDVSSEILLKNNVLKSLNLELYKSMDDYSIIKSLNDENIPSQTITYLKSHFSTNNINYLYKYEDTYQCITDNFVVKLKQNISLDKVSDILLKYQCTIIDTSEFVEKQYVIYSTDYTYNTLELSNIFTETGLFEFAEPEFLLLNVLNTNDTYFSDQWALNNTGQNNGESGIDINIIEAWNITQGISNVKTALIDVGVELSHQDLYLNLENGYDATGNNSMGNIVYSDDKHGTNCAGIIGAIHDNGTGIAGIAPQSKILPIRAGSGSYINLQSAANSIYWAVQNGASIISNSWSGGSPINAITNAINNALTFGRDGKGCVVVFSSGNNNKTQVEYPSRLDGVISVGAIDRCGVRSGRIDIVPQSCDPWSKKSSPGSSYGSKLSIVAPGTNVYTTNINNGYTLFGGTSAACPHVSGIVALVLSVNPDLTAQQVRDIIEATAQKVRPDIYNYTNDGIHNNGTWNNEMGYGLVDAYAAVKMAQEYKYSDLYVRDVAGDDGTVPSVTNGIMWDSPDIWIEDMNGNKITNPYGNTEYKVCVRVHNRSRVTSTGEERLFLNWAKAGIDLVWNENWISENVFDCGAVKGGVIGSANGTLIPAIAPNGSEVVKVTWLTPMSEDYENCTEAGAENWHFCLTARVHDGEEIEGENESLLNMGVFTENNNNVAWKNISILNSEFSKAVVSISNPYNERHNFSIRYKHTPNQADERIQNFADVYITLSEGLFNAWQEGGQVSQGIKQSRGNQFLLTDNEVVFENLTLEPKELHTIATDVNFYTQRESKTNSFDFDIVQYCKDCESEIIGGEHYTAIKDGNKDFKAIAIEDKTILYGETTTFTTNSINEQANYIWYNQAGDTLSIGQTLTTIPQNSQSYILEVTTLEGGYKDKDTVSVEVKRAIINSITPNPANTSCTINYELSQEINNAKVVILNTLGNIVYIEELPNVQNNGQAQISKTINLQNLSSGQYTLQITTQTETLTTKTLIIQA